MDFTTASTELYRDMTALWRQGALHEQNCTKTTQLKKSELKKIQKKLNWNNKQFFNVMHVGGLAYGVVKGPTDMDF